jgi:tight adherence protein B
LKRLPLIVAVAFALLAGTAAAGTTASKLRLSETKGPAFPVRTYVLSLPNSQTLSSGDVSVRENGQPVVDPKLVPARRAAETTFGTVLVLDKSYSMKGPPLAAALAAAQAFVALRNPNAQVGVVEFNRANDVPLKLTTSGRQINEALAVTPPVTTGTHIYDAVAKAEAMLRDAHISSGSIVVLSDGADTGSTKSLNEVAKAAVKANTRIYTIGVADQSYDPRTLKALARAGNGEFTRASVKSLAPLFDQLSRTISDEYLLQYKSLAGPEVPVRVSVRVRGLGATSTRYRTPPLPATGTSTTPYQSSVASDIWKSPITMIVIALLVAGVVAFLVIGLLRPRRSGLPARMAEFVSIRDLQKDKGQGAAAGEEAAPEPTAWERFEKTLEIADIHVEPEWIVAGTVALTGIAFLLIYAITGSYWWAILAFVIPYLSREWVLRTLKRRRDRFAEQLPDALQVVASALRSGHSFAGALAVVVESSSEPMKSEMQRVVADEQLGVPIQESLGVVAERMASRDIEQLALVAQLQREAGGDSAEVIDRVAETVRERFDLRRLIQTLTMQGRMSRWIVTALPIVIVIVIRLENPHYFHPLVSTLGGKVVLILAAAWAIAGSFVIKRIVEIEV